MRKSLAKRLTVEESAIAQAFKKVAEQEQMDLLPVLAKAQANALPFKDDLADYQSTLNQIVSSATDDCVRMLADEGRSLKQNIERVRTIRENLTDNSLSVLRRARAVIEQLWPSIEGREEASAVQRTADDLRVLIASPTLYQSITEMERLASDVEGAYETLYTRRHEERQRSINVEIENIKGHLGTAFQRDQQRRPNFLRQRRNQARHMTHPPARNSVRSASALKSFTSTA